MPAAFIHHAGPVLADKHTEETAAPMPRTLVSIRESMDSLESADTRFRQVLSCYMDALTGVQLHVFGALAAKSNCQPLCLDGETAALKANPDAEALESARARLEEQLGQSAARIRTQLAGLVDLEEVLAMLTGARKVLTTGNEREEGALTSVAANLDAASKLDDIESLRTRIRLEVRRVNDLVHQMREDNQRMLNELDEEMNRYRRRLKDVVDCANRDLLTGIGNRRLLYDRLTELIPSGGPLCLLLIDLNRFKRINDVHGHLAGDELLRAFSSRILQQLRPDDTASRWGGDEFVIVLPCSLGDAMTRSRMLEQTLCGDYSIHVEGRPLRIRLTLSIGIAEYRPGETVDQLMARADQSLYTHKLR